MLKMTLCALGLSTLALSAHAHQIWLEQPDQEDAVIRFGEFGDNLREASPGLLDRFGKPTATLISGKDEKQSEANKTADGFALPFSAAQGATIVAEDANFPLRTFKMNDKDVTNWFYPAARLITSFDAQPSKLPLDIVPAGESGEFKVVFKDQPLPKAKVTLITQSGWVKEDYTDDKGLVSFDMPWKGQYVAEASHTDRTPGERGTEKYDGVNYVTTLTYVSADGVEPIPAGPVATPNK